MGASDLRHGADGDRLAAILADHPAFLAAANEAANGAGPRYAVLDENPDSGQPRIEARSDVQQAGEAEWRYTRP